MYEVGERRIVVLAGLIFDRGSFDSSPDVCREAVWALGKLAYDPGLELAWRFARSEDRRIQKGALWAIGNIGGKRAEWMLFELLKEIEDEDLRQIIGGGIKKSRGESTRVSRQQVTKRLPPPATTNPEIRRIVVRLTEVSVSSNFAEIVSLRSELQELDPLYFQQYMASIRQVETFAGRLDDPKVFY